MHAVLDQIWAIFGTIVTGVIGWVGIQIGQYIKAKHLEKLATIAVEFAEEAFNDLGGKKKFEEACNWLSKKTGGRIAAEDIEALIQSAVKRMRDGLTK